MNSHQQAAIWAMERQGFQVEAMSAEERWVQSEWFYYQEKFPNEVQSLIEQANRSIN